MILQPAREIFYYGPMKKKINNWKEQFPKKDLILPYKEEHKDTDSYADKQDYYVRELPGKSCDQYMKEIRNGIKI